MRLLERLSRGCCESLEVLRESSPCECPPAWHAVKRGPFSHAGRPHPDSEFLAIYRFGSPLGARRAVGHTGARAADRRGAIKDVTGRSETATGLVPADCRLGMR